MAGAAERRQQGRETAFADALVLTSALPPFQLRKAVEATEAGFWRQSGDRVAWWAYSDALRLHALGEYSAYNRPLPWQGGAQ